MSGEKAEDLNELGAKLIKAELMGDDELVESLKLRLEKARKLAEQNKPEQSQPSNTYKKQDNYRPSTSHKSHDKGYKHKGGHRRGYEDEETKMFKRNYEHDEYDDLTYDDFDTSSKKMKKKESKFVSESNKAEKQKEKEEVKSIDRCPHCFDNAQKHLIASIGKYTYLCLPSTESLVEGNCMIIPISHCSSSVTCDEEVWSEIQQFKRALVNMFEKKRIESVFYELYSNENKNGHMIIECVPLGMDVSNMAPIYFKKAIIESESEWSTNKKIIDLKDQTVRNVIPKNMPYFTVGFGMENGYAHVIEKSEAYPNHFAKEVISGILDLDPLLWMRPRKESFNEQSKKVIEFSKWWKPFDFNEK